MFLTLALILSPPAPVSPTLAFVPFLGGTAGETVTLTLRGSALKDAKQVFLDQTDAKAEFLKASDVELQARFQVPRMSVGVHALRVATKTGITNMRPFVIDDLKTVPAKAGLTKKESAMVLTEPCTVTAQTVADASDFYKLSVKAKERWTLEVVGRRMGSAIDPVLIVHDAKSFKELPGLYADDTIGLQSDPRLTHTFEKDAEIIIEVRDTTYRGGLEYRLRIGHFPNVDSPMPLTGSMASHMTDQTQAIFSNHFADYSRISDSLRKPRGWSVSFAESEIHELSELEPNDNHLDATVVKIPVGISAKFQTKNDRDCFPFDLKKGDKIRVVAEVAEFALATEVLLELLDSSGKVLAKSDPMQLPAAIDFDAPADGRFVVRAEHLNYAHGPMEAYHLKIDRRVPDAYVALGEDHVTLPGTLKIANATRLEKYEGEINFAWQGDPAISVKGSIPAKKTPNEKESFTIALEAKTGTPPGVYFGKIVSTVKGARPHVVSTKEVLKPLFAGLPVLPAHMDGVVIVVVPAK